MKLICLAQQMGNPSHDLPSSWATLSDFRPKVAQQMGKSGRFWLFRLPSKWAPYRYIPGRQAWHVRSGSLSDDRQGQ